MCGLLGVMEGFKYSFTGLVEVDFAFGVRRLCQLIQMANAMRESSLGLVRVPVWPVVRDVDEILKHN